jgi:hypothetical protein
VNNTETKKKEHYEINGILKKKNGECAACLKYSVLIFVEKIYKMQYLEGSVTTVLYTGRTVLNPYPVNVENTVTS